MIAFRYAAAASLLLLAAACGRPSDDIASDLPSAARGPVPASLLRIPRDGGVAQLYRLPSLDTLAWSAVDKLPAVERVIGADPEQGLVFVLDRKQSLVGLDLDTRRVRTHLRQVRIATLGPDGVVYAVDTGSTVTQLVRRAPVRFRSKLQGEPRQMHATMNGAVLARLAGKQPVLEILGSDQQPTSIPIPNGELAATHLGDLVAIATDTAVVLYSADPKREPLSFRTRGGVRAVAFSPSGHLVYAVGERAELLVINRFGQDILGEVDLPGPGRDVRSDFYGRWLLVRPATGDSVWVVDVGTRRYVGAVAAAWDGELPVVAAPNAMLVRRGNDLVALDLAGQEFPETGRIEGGASDLWLPIAWHPAGEPVETPLDADSAAMLEATADSAAGSAGVYLQVSSSRNPSWAQELSAKLRVAGLPASVLPPKRQDEAYRVVLGPYATREQAEATGRGIGMPSFVITAQGD